MARVTSREDVFSESEWRVRQHRSPEVEAVRNEKDSGPEEAGGQESHDPEEDSGPEEAGGQDI
jgi:hypothetical protein